MAVLLLGLLAAATLLLLARMLPAYLRFRRLELAIDGPPSLPLIGNLFDIVGITEENLVARQASTRIFNSCLFRGGTHQNRC